MFVRVFSNKSYLAVRAWRRWATLVFQNLDDWHMPASAGKCVTAAVLAVSVVSNWPCPSGVVSPSCTRQTRWVLSLHNAHRALPSKLTLKCRLRHCTYPSPNFHRHNILRWHTTFYPNRSIHISFFQDDCHKAANLLAASG